ncbi:MAG: hypothetical protein D6814_10770, partial [Calditrichaeota bacterium]
HFCGPRILLQKYISGKTDWEPRRMISDLQGFRNGISALNYHKNVAAPPLLIQPSKAASFALINLTQNIL